MKKSLLSLLAVAVAAVGCQNYDDQFDDLNSQISALSSQIAGLAQVQSDLSALATTVSNLQAGVAQTVDDALADGLQQIDDAVAELQAAADNAASSEDVQAIADSVAAQDAVLQEVLANSSVQTAAVEITNVTQLDAWYALKGTLTIVNNSVTINATTDMDTAKLQEILDQIVTTTGAFTYTADADVEFAAAFPNLTGVATLTIDMEGNVALPSLTNATVVEIDEDNSTTIVDLGALETVTSLSNGEGAGTFGFSKATNVHLTSLKSYDGDLSIEVNKGGTILLDAYRDVDADGDATGDDLSIKGPASFTVSELVGTGSNLTLTEVATAVVNGYNGTITLKDGVESFSADHVVTISTASATDLVSFDITGALDADADAEDEEGPAIDLDGHGDLETVSLSGKLASVRIDNNGNLTSVTIDGDVSGSAGVYIASNSDLTDITLTGSKMAKLQVTSNGDLETLDVDTTWRAYHESEDGINGNLTVTSNESLVSLTVSSNNIEDLNVSSNSDLETLDFTGVDAIGADGEATIEISSNNLTASKVDADAESITSDSGMSTLKDYLDAIAADADSTAM